MTDMTEQIYENVYQQVVRLHAHWRILHQLFSTEERRRFLDEKASAFFGIIQEALTESVLMALMRLTDPAETRRGRDQNLSLARLVESVRGSDDEFSRSIDETLQEIQYHCGAFREWRNRVIAHTDQPTVFRVRPLPAILQEEIERAMQSIRGLMHRIEYHLQKGDVRYEEVISKGDGDDIVFFLQQAEEYENYQRDRDLAGP